MNNTVSSNHTLDRHHEERVVAKWTELNIYEKLMNRTDKEQFVLREMPIAIDNLDLDNLGSRIHQDIFLKNKLLCTRVQHFF